jgi:hypothetical protein
MPTPRLFTRADAAAELDHPVITDVDAVMVVQARALDVEVVADLESARSCPSKLLGNLRCPNPCKYLTGISEYVKLNGRTTTAGPNPLPMPRLRLYDPIWSATAVP